ncbi:MAG: TolC family protein [Limisphaerales bacterium]
MKSKCSPRRRHPLAVAPLVILLMTSPDAWNQEPAAPAIPAPESSYSLEALVAEALEKNPELRFYDAEILAAKSGLKTAGLLPNPELSGGVGVNRQRFGGLSAEGVAWSVSVVQPFEWPGRISLRKAIANHDIELARLGRDRFRSALAGRVRTLAYGLFAAQERSAAATEVAERFRSLRETLVQRDPAGLTPLLEMRVIEATEVNAQRRAGAAEVALQSALLELNQLRGAAVGAPLVVSPTHLTFPPPKDRTEWVALALANSFELKARALELEQQGFRVDLARNERYPTLSIGPSYSVQEAGTEEQRILGVGISLPLPLWNRNKGNIDAAAARRTQAEVAFSISERETVRNVLEAAMTYETKRREIGNWRPDSVGHFRNAAEVADRHYRLGAVPISTYVELQKQYLDAVESLLDTQKEALEAAARLETLTGVSVQPSPAVPTEDRP